MSRQVFRIEAFAGDRKLDAYVIPTTKPTRRKSAPLSRYDRLAPSPSAWGPLHSMDGVTITDGPMTFGIDLSAEEDLTAIWTIGAPHAAQAWRRAAARGRGEAQDPAEDVIRRAAERLGISPDALSGLSDPEPCLTKAKR